MVLGLTQDTAAMIIVIITIMVIILTTAIITMMQINLILSDIRSSSLELSYKIVRPISIKDIF